jgi:hypothetical protein
MARRVRRRIAASVTIAAVATALAGVPVSAAPSCTLTAVTPNQVELTHIDLPSGGYYKATEIYGGADSVCSQAPTVLRVTGILMAYATGYAPTPAAEDTSVVQNQQEAFVYPGLKGCPYGRIDWRTQGEHEWLDYTSGYHGGPQTRLSGSISTICAKVPILPPPSPVPSPTPPE